MRLVEAAALVLEVAAARAGFIASDFGLFAADRLDRSRWCGIVQIVHGLLHAGVSFGNQKRVFDLPRVLFLGRHLGGGDVHDGERGFEANGWGRLRVGEDAADVVEGKLQEFLGIFPEEERAVILRVAEGELEADVCAPPVGDGVAMNAGLIGGLGEAGAGGNRVECECLFGGENDFRHTVHFLPAA